MSKEMKEGTNISIIKNFFKTGLIVENKSLSKDQILKLTKQFGKLMHPNILSSGLYAPRKKNSAMEEVHIVGHSPSALWGKELNWHQDGAYQEEQDDYFGVFLYPLKNSSTVDTLFSDLQSLYNDLPTSDKKDLENIRLVHHDPVYLFRRNEITNTKILKKRVRNLIMIHPVTRKKCLYLSPLSLNCSFIKSSIYKLIMDKVPNYTQRVKWVDRKMFCLSDNLRYMHKTEPSEVYKNNVTRIMWRVQFNYEKIQLY